MKVSVQRKHFFFFKKEEPFLVKSESRRDSKYALHCWSSQQQVGDTGVMNTDTALHWKEIYKSNVF